MPPPIRLDDPRTRLCALFRSPDQRSARVHEFSRLERRAVDYADPALAYLTGGSRTSSGEPVDVERSIGLTAVWACVTLIAGSIASMPLILYARTGEGRERYVEHPLYDVLHARPNPVQSVVAFWEAMVTALLLRGNAFASLTRDDDTLVRAMWFINPDRVQTDITRAGRLVYTIHTGAASQKITDANMLHVVGPMSDDGYSGRSVITACREALGMGLALERYGAEFFTNAATPRGVLQTKTRLSDTARATLAASLAENHGSRGRRHKTVILEEGLEWQALGISHEHSQFIESKRFTVEEVARMFGVPGHMVGAATTGSLTYSNAETEALRLLKHTLGPWLARIERRQLRVHLAPANGA